MDDIDLAEAQDVLDRLNKRDPHQAALLHMLISMEADITKDGWDQLPVMIAMKGFKLDERQYAVASKIIGRVPADAAQFGGYGVAEFIRMAADNLADNVSEEELDAITAMALSNEGWMISVDHKDEVATARAMREARNHTIHERPDRVEVRVFTCIDRDGVYYTLERVRDGGLRAGVRFTYEGDDEGQIPDAMRHLMTAVNDASA